MLNWIQIGGPIMWMLIALSVGAMLIFAERVVSLHRAQIKTGDFLRGIGNVLGRSGPPPPAAVVEAVSICDQTEGPVARMVRAAVSPLVGLGGSALWPMGLLIALSNGAALFCGWRALQHSRNIIKAKEEKIVKK